MTCPPTGLNTQENFRNQQKLCHFFDPLNKMWVRNSPCIYFPSELVHSLSRAKRAIVIPDFPDFSKIYYFPVFSSLSGKIYYFPDFSKIYYFPVFSSLSGRSPASRKAAALTLTLTRSCVPLKQSWGKWQASFVWSSYLPFFFFFCHMFTCHKKLDSKLQKFNTYNVQHMLLWPTHPAQSTLDS